jgi:hypothetical protein
MNKIYKLILRLKNNFHLVGIMRNIGFMDDFSGFEKLKSGSKMGLVPEI